METYPCSSCNNQKEYLSVTCSSCDKPICNECRLDFDSIHKCLPMNHDFICICRNCVIKELMKDCKTTQTVTCQFTPTFVVESTPKYSYSQVSQR